MSKVYGNIPYEAPEAQAKKIAIEQAYIPDDIAIFFEKEMEVLRRERESRAIADNSNLSSKNNNANQ
jgi:hypothetical protein